MSGSRDNLQALAPETVNDFLQSHRLPDEFRTLITDYFMPLALWVFERRSSSGAMLLGINGAQGTGKSTLADFLQIALGNRCGWRVAVLSIDDFYLTKAERTDLADQVHPLLATRGVPGTHDTDMLSGYLDDLERLAESGECRLPRFDKARDDRARGTQWPLISGPVDLIILEGWCVGSTAESTAALTKSVNDLERDRDPAGVWRKYANDRLGSDYARLFARLNALIFMQAPSFDAVYRWRLEQERKLAVSATADTSGIMSDSQIAEFIRYYERITRSNLQHLPQTAEVVFVLNEQHSIVGSLYRD